MNRHLSFRELFDIFGLVRNSRQERVLIEPNMSGLEEDPRNDWLYVALAEIRRYGKDYGKVIEKAAFIGSANGIDVIAALRILTIRDLTVTDIVPEILPGIEHNIRENSDANSLPEMRFVFGRDAEPLPSGQNFIYANLPLIMVSESDLSEDLATTTLTDAAAYQSLGQGADDLLVKWSLLPQLGFLLSAREKLKVGGKVITLIGGRVPDEAINECFNRADMSYERGTVAVMRQSDEEFVKQYADYEQQLGGASFLFYNEAKASAILESLGEQYPAIVARTADEIRTALKPAALSAAEAWAVVQKGDHIAHLAYGFRAWRS